MSDSLTPKEVYEILTLQIRELDAAHSEEMRKLRNQVNANQGKDTR